MPFNLERSHPLGGLVEIDELLRKVHMLPYHRTLCQLQLTRGEIKTFNEKTSEGLGSKVCRGYHGGREQSSIRYLVPTYHDGDH